MITSAKMEQYYHPERFYSIWWSLHPIWTQMCKEYPQVADSFPNTADMVARELVR
jgi:hypothetical protein